jgi:membrane protease YdiL (CAAX protease family)
MRFMNVFLNIVAMFFPSLAYAYVGPGLGLGAIGTIVGVLLSILLALLAILWYPLKRLFGKGKKRRARHDSD